MSDPIQDVANLIKSGKVTKIAFLTGAGVSVGAGIPDFRSPGGMYDTLQPQLLTASDEDRSHMKRDPTYVVSNSLFSHNQFPYLELRKPFILGIADRKWKATAAHFFMQVCEEKGLLVRVYTQNIDGLDYQTDIPPAKLESVHGTLYEIQCESCKKDFPGGLAAFLPLLKTNIRDIYGVEKDAPAVSSPILCPHCSQPGLKPRTVLYGSPLPRTFFQATEADFDNNNVDCLIVMGTSLTVGPANLLPSFAARQTKPCYRVLLNKDAVGEFSSEGRVVGREGMDFFIPGSCDQSVLRLVEALGWTDDLMKYRDRMAEGSLV
eukprot:PhF_6_TR22501/c0_g1_i3/m.31904